MRDPSAGSPGDDLAGVDPDPDLEPKVKRGLELLVQRHEAGRASSFAVRTARRASSSCATGTPKTAITSSPTNFSTVPPCCSTICAHPLEEAGLNPPIDLRVPFGEARSSGRGRRRESLRSSAAHDRKSASRARPRSGCRKVRCCCSPCRSSCRSASIKGRPRSSRAQRTVVELRALRRPQRACLEHHLNLVPKSQRKT